ncbi:hypothetical protein [Methylobacterium oxalidis]|uniref:Uncharacterized protein n=1 Tax=Methylobacterium oxalidis TaxID=944322 RepID=A0A512JCB7_9HYPH|nr:hypothetical protein [Methylobacterium oxalidis]GEP07569.1 hypothetical protein MOX02_56070 [Methylobacterium oxalidis]GJE35109.1 hypothetical protein LDDCCGHA_5327 [Methylobacterium oxalidis]GLS61716.1 hypothetical protein GCM10007888_00970 [Methylobacterium oxalidis]
MMLFEKARENAAAIRQLGERAIAEARRAGVPAFTDPSLGEGIIREMPDGTRHRLVRVGDEDVVVESFGPRP